MPAVDGWIWVFIVGIAVGVPVAAGLAVYRTAPANRSRTTAGVAGILGGWLVVVLALAGAGAFRADAGTRFPLIGLGVGVPLALGLILTGSKRVRHLFDSIPQSWLLAAQAPRVLGVAFLVLMAEDKLPAHFALAVGLGDIFIGMAGPVVAYLYARRSPGSRGLAVAFNFAGLADLAMAVGTGFLSAPSPFRLFMTEPSTQLMTVLPMVLIPIFLVPTFALVHVVSLRKLAEERTAALTGSPRTAGGV